MRSVEEAKKELYSEVKKFLAEKVDKLLDKELEEFLGYSKHERRDTWVLFI